MARFKIRSQKSDINFNSAFIIQSRFLIVLTYPGLLDHMGCVTVQANVEFYTFLVTVTASAINMFIVHCKGQSPTMPFLHWSIMSYEISSQETNSSWNIVISHGLCCQFVNVHYFSLYLH